MSADKLTVVGCVALPPTGLKAGVAGINPGNVSFPLANKGSGEDGEESKVHSSGKAVPAKQEIALVNYVGTSVADTGCILSPLSRN